MVGVYLEGGVWFSSTEGVHVDEETLELTPEELYSLIKKAWSHMDDPELVEACGSGEGPLLEYGREYGNGCHWFLYPEYLEAISRIRIQRKTSEAKTSYSKLRRSEFNRLRPQLVLQMIEAGQRYVCSCEGCAQDTSLTVDHIIPLSRGGSDDVSNLRFLCQPHNSQKRDRT